MSINGQTEKVSLPILALKVHGITVPQPIELIEETLAKHLAQQRNTLQNIRSTHKDDEERLHKYGRDLLGVHDNIQKWGTPLRDFASYKYPHPDSLVATA